MTSEAQAALAEIIHPSAMAWLPDVREQLSHLKGSAPLAVFSINESSQNRVEYLVKMLADVFRQKSQHEISILLQQDILPPVSPVSLSIRQMLATIHLDNDTRLCAKEVNLHPPIGIE